MFAVIYRFHVTPGSEAEFEASWAEVTELIVEEHAGLGSRLHRDEHGVYFAYAEWRDRNAWQVARNAPDGPALTLAFKRMRACCIEVEPMLELDVVNDLLLRTRPSREPRIA